MANLCVFCGSQVGNDPRFTDAARHLAELMLSGGHTLVYGGGRVGLMGILALSVLRGGGKVIGVIPKFLSTVEVALDDVSELILVDTMAERKAIMAQRSDAFATLPGAYGTGDELFEMLTASQLGFHRKPVGLLNVGGFFDGLIGWVDRMVADGLLKPKNRELLRVATTPEEMLRQLLG
jgi:uncharacterized protein (TIGR00730 family)